MGKIKEYLKRFILWFGEKFTFNKALLITLFLFLIYLTERVFNIFEVTGSYPVEFSVAIVTTVLGEVVISFLLKKQKRNQYYEHEYYTEEEDYDDESVG